MPDGRRAQTAKDWRALLGFADRFFFGKKVESRFDVLAYPDAELPCDWKVPEPLKVGVRQSRRWFFIGPI